MITNTSQDALHKAWLYRVLINIADNKKLTELYFKGGTCAAMAGFLDRFSVDLDFDYVGDLAAITQIKKELKKLFSNLGLEVKDESNNALQFFLRYPNQNPHDRNTLKVDVNFPPPQANVYEPLKLNDISRVLICQDIKTMFANKLVAVIDRYERNHSIAGRDIYDIHHYFINNYSYNEAVILERTGLSLLDFFTKLRDFIDEHITETILTQDLNFLLPYKQFQRLRKTLKTETLMLINSEIKKLTP